MELTFCKSDNYDEYEIVKNNLAEYIKSGDLFNCNIRHATSKSRMKKFINNNG